MRGTRSSEYLDLRRAAVYKKLYSINETGIA